MFGRYFSRPRRRSRADSLSASIETLEDRTLLSATSPTTTVDLSSLTVDQSSYSSTEILVKWRSDSGSSLASDARVASILPGATAEGLSPFDPDLERITLPDGTDVQAALELFQSSSLVEYAQLDYRVQVMTTPNDPQYGSQWDLENVSQTGGVADADIDASAAWDVTTGSGSTIVAVIDTGVDYTHPDLAGNMWVNTGEVAGDGIDNDGNGYVDDVYGYDFINHDSDPYDDQGHGTHVAGTIGAEGDNGIGISGINWDVQIMALKFLGADGSGSQSDAIEAILYAVHNGAQVINASWGGDPYSQALFDALSQARDAGTIFVTAAGNGDIFGNGIDNDTTPFYPANYDLDNIVSVAATDANDFLATFSNYGATTVDIAAPGVDILSTLPGGGYGLNSGTSMATPHVAGVIALVRDLHPEWTYDQVIQQVLSTVDPLPQLVGLVATGGRLNAAAAVGNPAPPDPPPPPVSLPVVETFNDGLAQPFTAQSGAWSVSGGRYDVDPVIDNDDIARIATLRLDTPLPADLQIQTTLNMDPGHVEIFGIVVSDLLTNGFVVFDYVDPSNFKFAGADMDHGQWVIGHRDTEGWHIDAAAADTIDTGVDYRLNAVITGGNTMTLSVGGVEKATFTWTEDVINGTVGVGARNALAHFDDVLVQPYVPVLTGTLPISEDFEDGVADYLQSLSGLAAVTNGQYQISATSSGDGVSTFLLSDPLPDDLEFLATINADDSSTGRLSNAFIIFDYQSATDFKFAGAYVAADQWLIGHRDSTGWVTDSVKSATIDPLTDYHLRLVVDGGNHVTLYVNDVGQLERTFASSIVDGAVGLGTRNADARFDDLLVQPFTNIPPTSGGATLPLSEDFEDGVADDFVVQIGTATVNSGLYQVVAATSGDGISTIGFADTLPSDLEVLARINVDPGSSIRYSNGLILFDYQNPTDFKFAGAYVGGNQWVIGHRNTSGWFTDATTSAVIDPQTDYDVRVVLDGTGKVTLFADDVERTSFTWSGPLTDGTVGVGTWNAVCRFDNIIVQEPDETPPPPSGGATYPLSEDFEDGVADDFVVQAGTAAVDGGLYQVTAATSGDGVSTINFADALPSDIEVLATINVDPAGSGRYSNGLIIFDYQSATNFKFAGAYAGGDQWVIGRRTSAGWVTDATASGVIDAQTDYDLRVVLDSTGKATLFAGGVEQTSYTYSGVLTDGAVGVGTWNAVCRFDNVIVQDATNTPPPPTGGATLPYSEDFEDGVADDMEVQTGTAAINGGLYQVSAAANGDGVSTIDFAAALPSNLEVAALINADPGSSTRFSNAFIIFDYVSATDFKFAGMYAGADQWVIGHRNASGWNTDAVATSSINALTDYNLSLTIQNDSMATLSVDGVSMVSFNFASSLTDGAIGVGTRNAVSRFDNITVSTLSTTGGGTSGGGGTTDSGGTTGPTRGCPTDKSGGHASDNGLTHRRYPVDPWLNGHWSAEKHKHELLPPHSRK
jgi:subtilisin family serine protease